MVMGMVGFADGYRKQQDAGERKRLELAKAFQEFQQNNPEATGMEYQAFMDSMSNGDNYLRGGMPSGPALRAVVGESERRRMEADEDRNYKKMERNTQLQQELEGTATGIMLNYADPGPNGYSQQDYNNMAADLEQRFPGVDLTKVGFDPKNMFSNERRRNAISMKIKDYMPTVREHIKTVGGKNVTPETLAQMGVPPALIQPMISQANIIDEEIRYDWAKDHREDIYTHALEAAAKGQENIYDYLVKVYGPDKLPERDSDFFTNIETRAVAENEKIQATNRTSRAKELASYIQEKTKTASFKASVSKQNREEILANLAEQLPQSDYDINMMFGSEDGVTKVTRGDILANPEKYLGAHIDGVVKEMMVVQGNESDQLRLQSQSAAQTKGEEYKLDQSKNAEKYFGEANSTGTGDNLGKNGRNARLAAHQLAKEYSMTPSVLSAMERVFRGLDELKDVGKIKQAVQADPEFKRATGGRTIVDDVNDVRQSTINGLAGPEITSFPDYTAEEETNFKEGIFEATDEAFNIATSYKDDPKYAIQMLELLRAEVKNSANKTIASWDHYGQLNKTVHGGLGWIAMDSEKWDDAVMQKMADELNKMVDGFDDEINHRIKDAEEQLTAQSDTTTTPISPDGTINVDAPGEGSWAFEKLKHEGGMILAEQTLGSAAEVFDLNNPIGGAFAAMGSLADSEQERARSQEVKGWYKANQDRLIEYVDQWRQQNNDNSVLKKVEHDIKTLTAAQLVEKYEDALLQLGNNRKLVPTQ